MNEINQKLLLRIKDVSHSFDYPLFKNISLDLYEKESVAIIGTSGSGKSTLLNIFSSLLIPNSGEVYFDNIDIVKASKETLLNLRKENFGIIFQAHYLFRGFNAYENLIISELLNNHTIDKELLKRLKIDHILKQQIGELSGGQQQRLSCARVLTKQPKIIFADEPTGNLDKDTANDLINILLEYIEQKNGSMIIVTHEDDIAYRCDRVFKLEDYKLKQLK